MIISASRRTDIPAFYAQWFVNRARAGHCCVVNPLNSSQVSYVSLASADVDVVVFWTRDAGPILPHLDELDALGLRYYFHYTITGYPQWLEPYCPRAEAAVGTFRELSRQIGKERVIWRYDPILIGEEITPSFHSATFGSIAAALEGYTDRVVVSIVDEFRSAHARLRSLSREGMAQAPRPDQMTELLAAMSSMSEHARDRGMRVFSCAEETDLRSYGIEPGRCVDDEYIASVFGIRVGGRKDPAQRQHCGCVISKDIGAYDTCVHGCAYCYATRSLESAMRNHQDHRSDSPSLVGWHDCTKAAEQGPAVQGKLF